jgi:hypothetical protein
LYASQLQAMEQAQIETHQVKMKNFNTEYDNQQYVSLIRLFNLLTIFTMAVGRMLTKSQQCSSHRDPNIFGPMDSLDYLLYDA